MKYRVHYSNQGKREKSPTFATYEEAEECADFLKFQGAKKVTIRKAEEL